MNVFVHAIHKRSKKCLTQNVDNLGSLGPISIIQPPFNSSCVALQYEPGTTYLHRAVPQVTLQQKNQKFQYNYVVFLYVFSEDSEVAEDYSQN